MAAPAANVRVILSSSSQAVKCLHRLVGREETDELRYTQSGAALAGFTVAVSHRSKHNGEWQDVNDGFFRCTAWRSVAENAAHTLKKGMRAFVAGKLVQRSWQDDASIKRQTVEIQVGHVGPDLQFQSAEVVRRLRPERSRPHSYAARDEARPRPGLRRARMGP
jgi:single-strand DNA-binding protein